MMAIISALIFGWTGYQLGWVSAHKTVAHECKTLGGFYVGEEVFKCHLATPKFGEEE